MGAAESTSWLESLSTRAGADGAARTIRSRRMRRMVSRPLTCQQASGPITAARTMRVWFMAPAGGPMDQFIVPDEQFAKIAPHLPTDTRGEEGVDVRRVISGIVHVSKSGGCAAGRLGPKQTHCNRVVRWRAKGIRADLFETLAQAGGPPSRALVDSTAVKAHRGAAGGKGGSKVRLSVARGEGARPRSTRSPTAPDARSPFY